MEMIMTDTDEYREYIADKNSKDSNESLVKLKDLKPGDIAISAICKDGIEMIYLGNFFISDVTYRNHYSYENTDIQVNPAVKRAFFVIRKPNKKSVIKLWPIGNKVVKEWYIQDKVDSEFTNSDANLKMLQLTDDLSYKYKDKGSGYILSNPNATDLSIFDDFEITSCEMVSFKHSIRVEVKRKSWSSQREYELKYFPAFRKISIDKSTRFDDVTEYAKNEYHVKNVTLKK